MSLLVYRRVSLRLAAGALAACVAVLAAGPALADPAQLIRDVSAEVIELIKTKTGAAREAGIKTVLETKFDLGYMGKSALATYWDDKNQALMDRFLKAAATAEARAYSERFGQYGGQTVVIGKVVNRPNGVSIVESQLNQTSGPPIKVDWEVRNTGQGERITDVKVEGVSMIMTRRSDFKSYIQNNGGKVDALIAELESRAAR
jgi:phospholipid transport system substrate-binding protein